VRLCAVVTYAQAIGSSKWRVLAQINSGGGAQMVHRWCTDGALVVKKRLDNTNRSYGRLDSRDARLESGISGIREIHTKISACLGINIIEMRYDASNLH
jgi:hypothetical protein